MEYAEIVTVASRALARAGTPATLRLAEVVVDYPGAAARLGSRLRSCWPADDCEMPPYPAFG